ncbi:DNA-binding protein [Paenibacillus ferrarius]|uniref:DNA-binding protein n=1 Tax=Paenibacillus ferrarius TaxID=1469647 RepID=A0A1V4HS69_9BACL|nr:HU family DNA-binding protein [Paenibacillus ferrarius]OPH61737.1 DNA-binding protein [Paenibacillus ferrarius]
MNKSELINVVVEKTDMTKKDVTLALETTLEVITETLASGDSVKLVGFGNFETRKRSARKGRNPQSGAEIEIPESKNAAWKPAKAVKDAVNK